MLHCPERGSYLELSHEYLGAPQGSIRVNFPRSLVAVRAKGSVAEPLCGCDAKMVHSSPKPSQQVWTNLRSFEVALSLGGPPRNFISLRTSLKCHPRTMRSPFSTESNPRVSEDTQTLLVLNQKSWTLASVSIGPSA